jgi:hypothetical protein
LLRADKVEGRQRLDALVATLEYSPLTTAMMRQAAQFWAEARRQGRPTTDDKALDGDMILAAQAMLTTTDDDTVIVATDNVGHLTRFLPVYHWQRCLHPAESARLYFHSAPLGVSCLPQSPLFSV